MAQGDEYVDPMIPKVCRDPLPKSKDALERLRDAIYETLPTIGVDSRKYKLLEKRIEQINLILDQTSDRKMKPREWIFLGLAVIATAAAVLQLFDVF